MNNNDILRRLRFTFDFNDIAMLKLFQLGDQIVSLEQVIGWLKKEDDPAFLPLTDVNLAGALNGLVILKRGRQEGPPPVAETRLNNNIILRKLRIAMAMRDDDMLSVLEKAGAKISRHELSAFFRKPDHPHYRECKDQILRNFLLGLQKKLRGEKPVPVVKPAKAKKPGLPKPPPGGKKPFQWKKRSNK